MKKHKLFKRHYEMLKAIIQILSNETNVITGFEYNCKPMHGINEIQETLIIKFKPKPTPDASK